MTDLKKFKFLRKIERVILVLTIVLVSVLSILSATAKLGKAGSYIGGGIVLVSMLVLFLMQRKVDRQHINVLSQTNFTQDEAFSSLIESSPVAYLTIQTDGKITNANPAAVNLLQGEIDNIYKINFFSLIQKNDDTDTSVLKSKIASSITVNDLEVPILTTAEKTVWVLLSVYTYRHEGMRMVSLIDITEQKHIDEAKSEFVALATHQLRTPIAAIRWNVELLQRKIKDTKTDDQARYLEKIERNVFRMINLINDFLSVSKLEMGTFATTKEDVNLTEFFSNIVDEFSEKFTEKKIDLDRHDNPPELVIKSDPRLLHIIVSNLVSNAVKYLEPNGKCGLTYDLKDNQVTIIVQDDGIGIPEGEIEKLFTKFFRASNAQSHQAEGTGLGLYVVKQSVELLGGTIEVESDKDKGAKFTVTLPVRVVLSDGVG